MYDSVQKREEFLKNIGVNPCVVIQPNTNDKGTWPLTNGDIAITVRIRYEHDIPVVISAEEQAALLAQDQETINDLRSTAFESAAESWGFGNGKIAVIDSPLACLLGEEELRA
jgi:hypothetical protein